MRARESFEWFDIESSSQDVAYQGLTNTFNLFYEKPMEYSIGLAGGSIFSGLSTTDTPLPGFSDEIKTTFIGLEAKYFPTKALRGFFVRPGLYWKTLNSKGVVGKVDGFMGGVGLGYEIPIWEQIHLVPETGTQFGDLGAYPVNIKSVSLALHFYNF